MKCVRHKGKIKGKPWHITRVTNEAAQELVALGTFVYVAKRQWKEEGRP